MKAQSFYADHRAFNGSAQSESLDHKHMRTITASFGHDAFCMDDSEGCRTVMQFDGSVENDR